MRKIKLFFSFISILVIIYFIIVYTLLKYINEDNILSYIEKDLNIVVEKINTKIFPIVEISTDVTRINNENVIANNFSLILSQPHLITFGNLDLKIDEMFINNLVFDNINVYGKVNYISNYLNDIDNLDNILNGTYIITSNLSLKTTNEEKFLISFLKLFFEKIENNRNDNFALSTLLKVLNENKSILKGSITKEKNIFFSNDLLIQNEDNKILVSGIYNFLENEIKLDLDLEQDGVIYVSAEIFGKINSPKIKIDKDSKFLKNINQNNNLLEENVMQFLNSFLGIND